MTNWLVENGHRCTFFKLLHELARQGYQGPERLSIRPLDAMVFPARDIHAVTVDEEAGRAEVVAWFGGLYGVDSPLPSYFDEVVAEDSPRGENLARLLALVGNRFYHLLYEIWCHLSPIHADDAALQDFVRKPVLSLCGLGHLRDAGYDTMAGAPFFMQGMRNRWGLWGVLAHYLQLPIDVREFEPSRVPLCERDRTRLGSASTAVLGQSFRATVHRDSLATHIRVVCGPLDQEQYLDLLPGGRRQRFLAYLIHRYTPVDLEYRVELVLAADAASGLAFVLGRASTRLGATTILGHCGQRRSLRIVREGLSVSSDPRRMQAVVAWVEGGSATIDQNVKEEGRGQKQPSVQSA